MMGALASEIQEILADYPHFRFTFPADDDINRRRLIMRIADDTSRATQATLEKIAKENPELLEEFMRQRRELLAEE